MRILDFRHKKRRPLTSIGVPLVPKAGLEPARISTVDFESTASTDFATPARKGCGKRWDYTCYTPPRKPYPQPISSDGEKNGIAFSDPYPLSHFEPCSVREQPL